MKFALYNIVKYSNNYKPSFTIQKKYPFKIQK